MTRSPVVLSAPAKNGNIRVGSQYQVEIPLLIDNTKLAMSDVHDAACCWSPEQCKLTSDEVDLVISKAKEEHFNEPQALFFLHLKDYNLRRTLAAYQLYGPFPNIWDEEDTKMFSDALAQFGKDFHRVQELLPHKTRRELVDYYYSMKKKIHFKTPYRKSKRMKKSLGEGESSYGDSDADSASDLTPESPKATESISSVTQVSDYTPPSTTGSESPKATFPGTETVEEIKVEPVINRRKKRKYSVSKTTPNATASSNADVSKSKKQRCLPENFMKEAGDFKAFIDISEGARTSTAKRLTQEYEKAKIEHLQIARRVERLTPAAVESVVDLRPNEEYFTPIAHWTPKEILQLLLIFDKFGTDSSNAAEMLGTKTLEQVEEYTQLIKQKLDFERLFLHHKQ